MSPTITKCRSCHAQVYWVETELGKKMPVDAKSVPDGNIIFVDKKAHVLKAGEVPDEGVKRWVSHFVTCIHAKQHRKGK